MLTMIDMVKTTPAVEDSEYPLDKLDIGDSLLFLVKMNPNDIISLDIALHLLGVSAEFFDVTFIADEQDLPKELDYPENIPDYDDYWAMHTILAPWDKEFWIIEATKFYEVPYGGVDVDEDGNIVSGRVESTRRFYALPNTEFDLAAKLFHALEKAGYLVEDYFANAIEDLKQIDPRLEF